MRTGDRVEITGDYGKPLTGSVEKIWPACPGCPEPLYLVQCPDKAYVRWDDEVKKVREATQ